MPGIDRLTHVGERMLIARHQSSSMDCAGHGQCQSPLVRTASASALNRCGSVFGPRQHSWPRSWPPMKGCSGWRAPARVTFAGGSYRTQSQLSGAVSPGSRLKDAVAFARMSGPIFRHASAQRSRAICFCWCPRGASKEAAFGRKRLHRPQASREGRRAIGVLSYRRLSRARASCCRNRGYAKV